MEKTKKPFYKKWWFWLLVFLFLLVMGNMNTKNKSEDPEPAAEVQEDQQPTEDPITALVSSMVPKKSSDLKVIVNEGTVMVSFHYDGDSWDETDFCRESLSDYINLCLKAYELDGVEKVNYAVFVDLIDSKGNADSEKGIQICMPKDVFNTYNWENMKYKPDSYDQIESDCEIFSIHAGIRKNVDTSKIYYKG